MNLKFLIEDVQIEFRDKLPEIDPVLYQESGLKANDRQFLIIVSNVGEIYAENGNKVIVHLAPSFSENSLKLYLNGSVLGAILQQRCTIAFHGSSFRYNDIGVMISADSGFGKSTLALSFVKEYNCPFLTDDITPIIDGFIQPIGEEIKLTEESIAHFDLSKSNLEEIEVGYDKFFYRPTFNRVATELKYVYIGNNGNHLKITEIAGGEKLLLLLQSQYWKELNQVSEEVRSCIFQKMTNIAKSVRVFTFEKPDHCTISSATDYLHSHLTTLETY